jgi:hypothetical protein
MEGGTTRKPGMSHHATFQGSHTVRHEHTNTLASTREHAKEANTDLVMQVDAVR